jgi:hypothetical protein
MNGHLTRLCHRPAHHGQSCPSSTQGKPFCEMPLDMFNNSIIV